MDRWLLPLDPRWFFLLLLLRLHSLLGGLAALDTLLRFRGCVGEQILFLCDWLGGRKLEGIVGALLLQRRDILSFDHFMLVGFRGEILLECFGAVAGEPSTVVWLLKFGWHLGLSTALPWLGWHILV